MHRLSRRHLLAVTLLASAALPAAVQAQGPGPGAPFLSKPLQLVVGYAPGGAVDATARKLALALSSALGQQVLVENRAGASGNIGAEYVARAPADGHTLLFSPSTIVANPLVMKGKPPFDLQKDFTPIGLVASGPLLMLVPANGPASVAEFVAQARSRPERTNFGTGGFGAAGHLAAEHFKVHTGLQGVPVVLYKGTAPAITDLIGGQLSAMMEPSLSALPQVRGGKLKPLAITADKRDPLYPDVPTFAEAGYSDMVFSTWYGVWAPANLPDEIRQKLAAVQAQVLQAPDFKDWLGQQGYQPSGISGAAFNDFLAAEGRRYARIVREGKIQPE